MPTYLAGALHVAKRGESDVVERVVRYVMLAQVSKAVLEAPEGERVELRSSRKSMGHRGGSMMIPRDEARESRSDLSGHVLRKEREKKRSDSAWAIMTIARS